tara:strand:- start:11751 stop:12311 length:561 start_codon:yes stop_codon:yes gene_type:complete
MNKILIIFLVLLASCASGNKTISDTDSPTDSGSTHGVQNPQPVVNTNESGLDLAKYRNSLADLYSTKSNEVPESFQKFRTVKADTITNKYEGYRVQIYSGQDVAMADTIASIFRGWSTQHIDGYQAETYTFFKTPYYRVHVGDFHERDKAIEFSQIIKRRFREAWVVYDKVNPWNVPADTVQIFIK